MEMNSNTPISAMGSSRIARSAPHGDSHDVYSLTYEFPDGLILNHRGEHLKNRFGFRSDCLAQGSDGYLETGYTSRVRILANSAGYRGGEVLDLYPHERGSQEAYQTRYKKIRRQLNGQKTLHDQQYHRRHNSRFIQSRSGGTG